MVPSMLPRVAVIVAVMIAVAFVCGPAAEAAPKPRQRTPAASDQSPSLDGRTLGYPRTCGHDYYVYSGDGIPVGPYCH